MTDVERFGAGLYSCPFSCGFLLSEARAAAK